MPTLLFFAHSVLRRIINTAIALLFACCFQAQAQQPIKVAVSSNFRAAFESLMLEYQGQGFPKPIAIYGSSGKHAAQILNGLPVQLFLSADSLRPSILAEKLSLSSNNIRTYAVGKLALYSLRVNVAEKTLDELMADSYTLAIANPRLAPYGLAAKQVLNGFQRIDRSLVEIVQGENIGQAFSMIHAGGADIGLVAKSQVIESGVGHRKLVPEHLHAPITQDLLILNRSEEVDRFVAFLFSEPATRIIRSHGYGTPE